MKPQLEICCTSFTSAKIAEETGASRIELCDNILEGGTTPSAGLIASIREELAIPIHILIRPRGGDFVYTDDEFKVMRLDIAACLELGADGIVSGVLNTDNTIDQERTLMLSEMCREVDFTFHRAFDLVPNQFEALSVLSDIGVPRVLTSGGENNVSKGANRISELMKYSHGEVKIMAGGGLNRDNIDYLLKLGCKEFHSTVKNWIQRDLTGQIRMNALKVIPENRYMEASAQEISVLLDKITAYSNA